MRTYLIVAVFLLGALAPVDARDFAELPRAVLLPGAYPDTGVSFLPAGYADLAYTNAAFKDGEYDSFQVRSYANFGIFATPTTLATIFYGSYILAGPVLEGTEPGSERAQWLMNAVQFEYGLTVQRRIAPITLLAEYSRRSSHPLFGDFAEPAADILRVGVAPPLMQFGAVMLESLVRLSWIELYDFWEADNIPDPRAVYGLSVALFAERQISDLPLSVFGGLLWDPFVLRSGGVDGDIELDFGLALGSGTGTIELYANYFRTSDTEQDKDRSIPAELIGYGLRFVAEI